MRDWRRTGAFLGLLLLVAAGAMLLFWNVWAENASVLLHGTGRDSYILTAKNTYRNTLCALGRSDGEYRLVFGDETGDREAVWEIPDEIIPQDSQPAALYESVGSMVYIGIYNTQQEETTLQVYRIYHKGKEAELLLSEPCPGAGLREQMKNVRLSTFAEVNNAVTFAVLKGDTATFYQHVGSVAGVTFLQTGEVQGLRNAVALSDGSFVLITENAFLPIGGRPVQLPQGQTIEQVAQSGTSLYFVEGSSLTVRHLDVPKGESYTVATMTKDTYDMSRCTGLKMTSSGACILLLDGKQLMVDYGSALYDASGMLHRSIPLCILSFALGAAGVLAVTAILWYILCEQRRFYLPMLLRWGLITVVVALLGIGILFRFAAIPAYEEAAAREAEVQSGGMTVKALADTPIDDPVLAERLGLMFSGDEHGLFQDTEVAVFDRDSGGGWHVVSTNGRVAPGSRGELTPAFRRDRVVLAWQEGSKFWTYESGGDIHYVSCRALGSHVLCIDVNGTALRETQKGTYQWVTRYVAAIGGVFVVLTMLSLGGITRNLRRVTAGMERMAEGVYDQPVSVTSADEVASLADGLNGLSDTLRQAGLDQVALAQSYHRFVPERVLGLLDKKSILDVDKQTFVSRNLAAMMLCFEFPAEIYERSGRELFNNINEIIERTAPIVTRRGGAVFNFAYNGYDAVFEGGSAVAVSTAVEVQQEVLEINRERQEAGRPPVTLCIALDEGNVMVGVVGDESQIEVSSISSSFTVGRHLLELCRKLQASILCTEAVIRGDESHSSRYMGLCTEGDQEIRTYEIFDGDPYDLRKSKESGAALFSEGIFALYGRSFSQAKRIFLRLVHQSQGDGGARYYLYLADRLEKGVGEAISLDEIVT